MLVKCRKTRSCQHEAKLRMKRRDRLAVNQMLKDRVDAIVEMPELAIVTQTGMIQGRGAYRPLPTPIPPQPSQRAWVGRGTESRRDSRGRRQMNSTNSPDTCGPPAHHVQTERGPAGSQHARGSVRQRLRGPDGDDSNAESPYVRRSHGDGGARGRDPRVIASGT